jgi:hypothetical protein
MAWEDFGATSIDRLEVQLKGNAFYELIVLQSLSIIGGR